MTFTKFSPGHAPYYWTAREILARIRLVQLEERFAQVKCSAFAREEGDDGTDDRLTLNRIDRKIALAGRAIEVLSWIRSRRSLFTPRHDQIARGYLQGMFTFPTITGNRAILDEIAEGYREELESIRGELQTALDVQATTQVQLVRLRAVLSIVQQSGWIVLGGEATDWKKQLSETEAQAAEAAMTIFLAEAAIAELTYRIDHLNS